MLQAAAYLSGTGKNYGMKQIAGIAVVSLGNLILKLIPIKLLAYAKDHPSFMVR